MEAVEERKGVVALIAVVLVVVTLALYWQVGGHELTNVDDRLYVSQNEQVLSGLTSESIAWAFTDRSSGNWHPLTWLSLMLDCQLFENKSRNRGLADRHASVATRILLRFVVCVVTTIMPENRIRVVLFYSIFLDVFERRKTYSTGTNYLTVPSSRLRRAP